MLQYDYHFKLYTTVETADGSSKMSDSLLRDCSFESCCFNHLFL